MGKSRIRYNDTTVEGRELTDYLSGRATHVRVYREDVGDEWPWHIDAVDDEGNYTEEVDRFATFEEALAEAPRYFEEYVLEDVTIDRDNQQPDVIYAGPLHGFGAATCTWFVTPDGVGRYFFDSLAEVRGEYPDLPIRYVSRIED